MEISAVEEVIYGKVVMCTGHTLGQHYWGGFKEGVGAAFKKCRHSGIANVHLNQCKLTLEKNISVFVQRKVTMPNVMGLNKPQQNR